MMRLAKWCGRARLVSVDGFQHCNASEYHRAIAFGRLCHAMRGELNFESIMLRWRDRLGKPGNGVLQRDQLFPVGKLDRFAKFA